MIEPLSWSAIAARLEPELGEPLARARRLTPPKLSHATWAARTQGAGELVVKVSRCWTWSKSGAAGPGQTAGRGRHPGRGLRLPPTDFTHNDLHLSNVLTDGERITGVIDWDEFGLGTRALDLVVLGFDCYRTLAHLADDRREGQPDDAATASAVLFSSILDRLQENYGGG
jgi:hypothetical protein